MSFKTILVYADASPDGVARIEAAAELAKRFDATLIGSALVSPMTDPYGDPIAGDRPGIEFAERRKRIAEEMKAIEATFAKAAATASVRTEWREAPQSTVDLIVLGRPTGNKESDFRAADVGAVLMRSGRPVLVLPPKSSATAQNIVVAWKNTRESRRALADALPFLKAAAKVEIVEITGDGAAGSDARAAHAFLAGHGVRADVKSQPLERATVEDQLLAYLEAAKANMVVAGGYGHTRLGEWVFGGVTEALIGASPIPALLSH